MSANASNKSVSQQTALAMNQALAAEQEAEKAVATCRQEAARIVENARRKARRIQQHTNKRISRISQRFDQRLKEELSELAHAEPASECVSILPEGEDLQGIVDQVVAELLGETEQ